MRITIGSNEYTATFERWAIYEEQAADEIDLYLLKLGRIQGPIAGSLAVSLVSALTGIRPPQAFTPGDKIAAMLADWILSIADHHWSIDTDDAGEIIGAQKIETADPVSGR